MAKVKRKPGKSNVGAYPKIAKTRAAHKLSQKISRTPSKVPEGWYVSPVTGKAWVKKKFPERTKRDIEKAKSLRTIATSRKPKAKAKVKPKRSPVKQNRAIWTKRRK
tara:strand:+ start:35 stop:355 length:321 start_codon:yes stop_codon:yes gene_type:complete